MESLLASRLILCMGGGGVGKTSTAAALALCAANSGRRCALITVDPARRLSTALGLDDLSAAPTAVGAGSDGTGSFDAMVLDTKRVFDDLVRRSAPSVEVAETILRNQLYETLSDELGGSTEYMAMEKVHELLAADYETIVVDTPPGSHARDLLAAPSRIARLVDSGVAATLLTPANILRGNRLTKAALATILAALQRWVGIDLVAELANFAAAFEPLLDGFRERAGALQTTLRGPDTAIVVITTPERRSLDKAGDLCRELAGDDLPVVGLIANQVCTVGAQPTAKLRCNAALRRKLEDNYARYARRAGEDDASIHKAAQIAPVLGRIPKMQTPVSSLDHVREMAAALLSS